MSKERWYPFVMLGCAVAVNFIYLGMVSNVMGLYTPSILAEFPGFARSSFTLTITLISVMAAVGNMLHTPVRERLRVRGMLLLGLVLCAGGMLLYAAAESLPVFYLGGAVIGLSLGFCGSGTTTLMVNDWFAKKKGTFVAVAMSGSGLGVAVFSPIISRMIEALGWRPALRMIAFLVVVFGLLLACLYRNSPREAGLPGRYGESGADVRAQEEPGKEHRKVRILGNPVFMVYLLLVFCMGVLLYAVMTNISVIATDMGYSIIQIGTFSSVIFAVNVAMQLPIGMGCDRFGTSGILYAAFGVVSLAHLLLFLLGAVPFPLMLVLAAIFGTGKTVLNNLTVNLVPEIASEEETPHMVTMGVAWMSLGSATGVYLVQFGYDLTGSYRGVYLFLIGLAAVCTLLDRYLVCARRRKREKM